MRSIFSGLVLMMLLLGIARGQSIPVVIELFTSEGCSSCPPADQLLSTLDREQPVPGVQLIVLSEHVDYWNSLGWSDPFSSREFTERQQRYVAALHVADPYTPQAVIDGRIETVGNSATKMGDAIERAKREKKVPLALKVTSGEKSIHVAVKANGVFPNQAEVLVAIAEERVSREVTSGENGGRLLTHTGVVRSLTKAGKLTSEGTFELDVKNNARWGKHLRVVALLVEHEGGKILGAVAMAL